MFQRVLVCVNDGEPSRRAFNAALGFAKLLSAQLTAIHVIETPDYLEVLDSNILDVTEQRPDEAPTGWAEKGASEARMKIAVIEAVGEPATSILEHARDGRFDLIVLGRRGTDTRTRQGLGAVSENVVRRSDIAVLVVP